MRFFDHEPGLTGISCVVYWGHTSHATRGTEDPPMRIHVTKSLFAWESLEDGPSLKTIRQVLETIPDTKLLASLEAARGRGRDDYPVRCLWGVLVLAVALRHPTIEACLAELRRNESLRKLIGI